MATERASERGDRKRQILHDLIRQHIGTVPYGLFFTVGEGKFLPNSAPDEEIEESSGNVLTKDGRVYSFWFGWDPNRQSPALVEWEEITAETSWLDDPEYQQARENLGFSAA